MGSSLAEANSGVSQKRLQDALAKTGVGFTVDANGNAIADPTQRASFNFVNGALSTGATIDQINEGRNVYAGAINRLDLAPGTLDQETIDAKVANNLRPSSDSSDPKVERILVQGQRLNEPSGLSIIKETVVGGAELLMKSAELYNENQTLATVLYGGVKAILGGGPVKSIALQLAQMTGSALMSEAKAKVISSAEHTAEEFTTDFAQRRNISVDLSLGGFDFTIGPKEFGMIGGQFAGGVVSTLLDGGVKNIAERGANVRSMVQPGETGKYGELAKRSRKDGLAVDHIPSHGANVIAAEQKLGRKLTDEEEALLKAHGGAIVVPNRQHIDESRTYGGRNNLEQRTADALNPVNAINQDIQKHAEYLRSIGKSDGEIKGIIADLLKKRNDLIPGK